MLKVVYCIFLRNISFVCLFLFGLESWGQQGLRKADSLFAIGQYLAAQNLYKGEVLSEKNEFRPNAILKMAYIAELNGDYTQSLYHLSLLSKIVPSESISQKMEAIAHRHHLTGYDFDDFGYLLLYVKKYGQWLYLFIIILTGYGLFELFVKYKKGESIALLAKMIVVIFLLGLIALVNVGERYKEAIVAKSPTFLRESASSASAVKGTIEKGNKVIVLGERDHWKLVYLRGKFVYIKNDDLLLI